MSPFTECRRTLGHFGGACGNCKWRDHASRCSLANKNDGRVIELSDDDDGDDDELAVVPAGANP